MVSQILQWQWDQAFKGRKHFSPKQIKMLSNILKAQQGGTGKDQPPIFESDEIDNFFKDKIKKGEIKIIDKY